MALSDWRERINQVDRRILALLNERAGYVLSLAPLKRREGIPIHEPGRERQVLDNLKTKNQGPLSDEAVCRIFQAVMTEMRAVQAEQEKARDGRDAAGRETTGGRRKPMNI